MKILIACEFSGIVRDAFIARGHDAWSCDLMPTERPGPHLQLDVTNIVNEQPWDMMIAFPPCTHLSVSGARWFKNKQEEQAKALNFIRMLLNAPMHKIAIENPVGIISTHIRKPDQIIQPYEYGDSFSKKTCLWLKGLDKLIPTKIVDVGERLRYNSGRSLPKWYADSFNLPPKDRAMFRSRTFSGIAKAMSEQWG